MSIRSDLGELNNRRTQFILIGGAIVTLAVGLALLMAWTAQRSISSPIVDLAAVARRVTFEKNYAVRAESVSHTREIDVLVDAFNEMLGAIEGRDQSLGEAREQLEDRVRQRTAELDSANQELESFSYSVSHDLRAPLRHVAGFAGLLEAHAGERLDDEGRRYIRTIVEAATKMGQLIDDLLSFSRTGRSALTKSRLSLNDVLREAKHEVDSNGGGKRPIDWHVSALPEVEGDRAMLRQVMVNLISNAVKYSSSRELPTIEIGSEPRNGSEVVVYVRDNGVGFNEQFSHKLFGVFQRLHSTDEFEGTGIGLANVKRIVQRHGGRVWAQGEVGRGATFYFSLPTEQRH